MNLRNTIFVRRTLAAHPLEPRNLSANGTDPRLCRTPRCASIAVVAGLVVANVHLCGGRFDDPHYDRLVEAKTLELKQLIEGYAPDVVAGDFNGERSDDRARSTLGGYPFFGGLADEQRGRFMRFYRDAHDLMDRSGYAPCYTEDNVGPTSVFGGTPDWVYVKRSRNLRVDGVRVIPAFSHTQKRYSCSDHHAVIVDLSVPDVRNHPSGGGAPPMRSDR